MVLAMWISTVLLCQLVVLNLSVNGYVLELVLGYNFEHNKQLAFDWLFIIAPYTVMTSPKKDETAVYGWSCWLSPSSCSYRFTDKLILT